MAESYEDQVKSTFMKPRNREGQFYEPMLVIARNVDAGIELNPVQIETLNNFRRTIDAAIVGGRQFKDQVKNLARRMLEKNNELVVGMDEVEDGMGNMDLGDDGGGAAAGSGLFQQYKIDKNLMNTQLPTHKQRI